MSNALIEHFIFNENHEPKATKIISQILSKRELFCSWYLTNLQGCGVSRICQCKVKPWVGLWQPEACLGANSGIRGLGHPCCVGCWKLQPAFLLSDPQEHRADSGSLHSLGDSASFPHWSPFSLACWGGGGSPLPPAGCVCPRPSSTVGKLPWTCPVCATPGALHVTTPTRLWCHWNKGVYSVRGKLHPPCNPHPSPNPVTKATVVPAPWAAVRIGGRAGGALGRPHPWGSAQSPSSHHSGEVHAGVASPGRFQSSPDWPGAWDRTEFPLTPHRCSKSVCSETLARGQVRIGRLPGTQHRVGAEEACRTNEHRASVFFW